MVKNIGLFLLIILLMNSCVFFGPSRQELFDNASDKKPYDVIIVPGMPYDSVSGKWSMPIKGRIYWSKFLYESGITKNIIYSGGAVYTPYIEGEIMAMYGKAVGIPDSVIYIESKAEHSTENIYYSYYVAKKLGFKKVAVATDPFQAKLLRRYPKKINADIDFIPFVIDSLSKMNKDDYVMIDAEKAKVKNFVAIVDRQSRFKRFLGTLGKNIIRAEEDVRKKKTKSKK